MTTDTKPGCYGAASIYSSKSAVCGACPHNAGCAEQAMTNLKLLDGKVDLSILLAAQKTHWWPATETAVASTEPVVVTSPAVAQRILLRATPALGSDEHALVIRALPVKAQEVMARLHRAGMTTTIEEQLRKGVNAMTGLAPKFLATALTLLVAGGFTRKTLRAAFINDFGWRDGAAASHTSIIVATFLGFGWAKESGGKLEIAYAL